MTNLPVKSAHCRIQILGIKLGNMLPDGAGHRIDLPVALTDGLYGIRVVLHLRFLNSGQ